MVKKIKKGSVRILYHGLTSVLFPFKGHCINCNFKISLKYSLIVIC